jgi:Fe-S cluster assembly ATPase SufC
MLAGPNGSGKSTLKHLLKPGLLGIYVNADDIEAQWRTTGQLDLSKYQVTTTASELEALVNGSSLIANGHQENRIHFADGILHVVQYPVIQLPCIHSC